MNFKLLGLGLFTLACSCATRPWGRERPHVNDSLLVHVPESEQTKITDARTRLLELRDQLAAAEADEREADRLVDLSRRNVDSLQVRASSARTQIGIARAHRTNEELEEARREADEVDAAVRFAINQTRYQENLAALADERIDLLQARIALAEAKVELAKARAVSELDRPAVEDVDVDAHRRSVADLSREVEQARIEALVARERVELQQKYVEEGREDVPEALRLQSVQAIDSVFEAKAFERHDADFDVDDRGRARDARDTRDLRDADRRDSERRDSERREAERRDPDRRDNR